MKPVELALDDFQKSLVKDARILRVFQVRDEFRPKGLKYEVHFHDPKNGLCRTVMAYRGRGERS